MAHIKCRYFKWRCNYGYDMDIGRICKDPEYGDECHNDHFEDTWWDYDKEMQAISTFCRHAIKDHAEFEGEYKKYDFEDGVLHIPHRHIDAERITYLEIDGRPIIGGSK